MQQLTVKNVSILYCLYDFYNCLAKGQHGVTRVNQFPWQFFDRLEHLKKAMVDMVDGNYDGLRNKVTPLLDSGLLADGSPIVTEVRRHVRSEEPVDNAAKGAKKGIDIFVEFTNKFLEVVNHRIPENNLRQF